jgi:16S rRNA (cytosine967-C5)-methyltransferase
VSRYHSYINSATEIISIYKGQEPFASFLKKFFAARKKYGSKDRKHISHLCYCYFRLGAPSPNFVPNLRLSPTRKGIEDRILAGLFLCSHETNEILAALKPEWNEKAELDLKKKTAITGFQLGSVFPWQNELSEGIEHEKFCESFFVQPDLFLRLRPGKEKIARQKLQQTGIEFKNISDSCVTMNNATKIVQRTPSGDMIIELDEEAVVQDYNSQQTGGFFSPLWRGRNDKPSVWDCCAGSGGKSIMVFDLNPDINLTVSDVRESILANLKKRFQKAGIKKYDAFVTDLTKPHLPLAIQRSLFDLIICDVPCTGSGAWGRTPEQLYYFEKDKIDQFTLLQKEIGSNVIPRLKQGGYFFYITCSVFRKENEEISDYIEKEFSLKKIRSEILNGYEKKADTMFVALFQKPS